MKKFILFALFLFHVISLNLYSDALFEQESARHRIEEIANNLNKATRLFERLNHLSDEARILGLQSHQNPSETLLGQSIKASGYSANAVVTPYQQYIVCKAPLESDVKDFWKMILRTNCRLIVMSCMPIESTHVRCTPYWKISPQLNQALGWNISLKKEEVLDEGPTLQRIVKRSFSAVHPKTKDKRTIVQLHFENWKDYGIPDLALFGRFIKIVDRCSFPKTPILVHCVAGIGRSGTFVAAHSLRKVILAGGSTVNIPQQIYNMRLQRFGLVSTIKQFQFVYKAMLLWL